MEDQPVRYRRGAKGCKLYFNGKLCVTAKSLGTLTTTDPCLDHDNKVTICTNLALTEDLKNLHLKFTVDGEPIANMNSFISKSTGNEHTKGGVTSGTIAGKAIFTTGAAGIMLGDALAVTAGCMMVSNNGNTSEAPLEIPNDELTPVELALLESPVNKNYTHRVTLKIISHEGSDDSPILKNRITLRTWNNVPTQAWPEQYEACLTRLFKRHMLTQSSEKSAPDFRTLIFS